MSLSFQASGLLEEVAVAEAETTWLVAVEVT
jgi:hypothetical protein